MDLLVFMTIIHLLAIGGRDRGREEEGKGRKGWEQRRSPRCRDLIGGGFFSDSFSEICLHILNLFQLYHLGLGAGGHMDVIMCLGLLRINGRKSRTSS